MKKRAGQKKQSVKTGFTFQYTKFLKQKQQVLALFFRVIFDIN